MGERGEDARPPVFILVCKNTAIAKVMHAWLGEDKKPTASRQPELRLS